MILLMDGKKMYKYLSLFSFITFDDDNDDCLLMIIMMMFITILYEAPKE